MIKVYEKKQTLVDSIQWNGDNYVEVTKFIIKNTKKPIQYFTHCGFDTFMINFHSKDVRVVKNGDYIVTENDDVLVVTEDTFKKNYKCVGVNRGSLKGSTGLYKEIAGGELRTSTICAKDLLKVLKENGITVCD